MENEEDILYIMSQMYLWDTHQFIGVSKIFTSLDWYNRYMKVNSKLLKKHEEYLAY